MTEREKMIEEINSVQAYGIMSNAFGGDLPVINEILADKLIEAGFGYIKDLKTELRSKVDYIHEQDDVIKDYKHRAGVAEVFLALIGYQLKKMKHRAEVAEKDLERHKRALYCACKASATVVTKELVKARVACFLRKAERELAEEKK